MPLQEPPTPCHTEPDPLSSVNGAGESVTRSLVSNHLEAVPAYTQIRCPVSSHTKSSIQSSGGGTRLHKNKPAGSTENRPAKHCT